MEKRQIKMDKDFLLDLVIWITILIFTIIGAMLIKNISADYNKEICGNPNHQVTHISENKYNCCWEEIIKVDGVYKRLRYCEGVEWKGEE